MMNQNGILIQISGHRRKDSNSRIKWQNIISQAKIILPCMTEICMLNII